MTKHFGQIVYTRVSRAVPLSTCAITPDRIVVSHLFGLGRLDLNRDTVDQIEMHWASVRRAEMQNRVVFRTRAGLVAPGFVPIRPYAFLDALTLAHWSYSEIG